jgi:tight adherence protein B
MFPSPQSIIALAALLALTSVAFSFKRSRTRLRSLRQRESWPAFIEAYVSALEAGLAGAEAIEIAVSRAPAQLRSGLAEFRTALQTKRFVDALLVLKSSMNNSQADELVQLLRLNDRFGGGGLVAILKTHAKICRDSNTADAQVRSKNSASLTVAKLGVASPWILLTILLGRPESASSFENPHGVSILLSGLAVCLAAYQLIVFLGRSPREVRVYATQA